MPRSAAYVPWSSANCHLLEASGNPYLRELEFRTRLRPVTDGETASVGEAAGMIVQTLENTIEGRAHQEEAALIYRMGTERVGDEACTKCVLGYGKFAKCVVMVVPPVMHYGSCANCVYQSATNGCNLAADRIAHFARQRIRIKDTKTLQKEARGKGSSKSRRNSGLEEVTNSSDPLTEEEIYERDLNEAKRLVAEDKKKRKADRDAAKAAKNAGGRAPARKSGRP